MSKLLFASSRMEAFGGGAADAAGFVNPTYSSTGISVAGGAAAGS